MDKNSFEIFSESCENFFMIFEQKETIHTFLSRELKLYGLSANVLRDFVPIYPSRFKLVLENVKRKSSAP